MKVQKSSIKLNTGSVVKNLSANAEDTGDVAFIPGLGSSLGGGNGNPLQFSCLGNPTDRGAWRVTVQKGTKNWTQLNTHAHTQVTFQRV